MTSRSHDKRNYQVNLRFFFSSGRRHTRSYGDWSSDVCSSDLLSLQSEHERWLTERHFKCPVTVFNYPREIKPFYMRLNDDGKTVTAMDLLVPGIGEIVGGSQREERLEVLEANMRWHKMDPKDYKWYLDLRRYGTMPHSGFGLGFERMLMFVTGVSNIRDVIPFARTPGSAEF